MHSAHWRILVSFRWALLYSVTMAAGLVPLVRCHKVLCFHPLALNNNTKGGNCKTQNCFAQQSSPNPTSFEVGFFFCLNAANRWYDAVCEFAF